MKYALLVLVFLFSCSAAHGQAGQATEIKAGPTPPTTCNASRGWLFWNTTTSQMQDCSATNSWNPVGVATGAGAGVFNISTACGGASNCLQWVDDDSTDNCSTATTTFFNTVNAYAGPGRVQLFIYGSGAGKAYKLATCNIPITNSSSFGEVLHLYATIDCAQSTDNCIQVGPTGQSSEQAAENYFIDGNGTLAGGNGLTTAGIHLEPGVNVFDIGGIHFIGPSGSTHQFGFGANNATLGNCTNYAIYIDNPIAAGTVHNTFAEITSTSSTSGGCGYANLNGSGVGTNTIVFRDNAVGAVGNVGGPTSCGSTGIVDGGSYGTMEGNNIYGFGMPIRIQGLGHRIHGGNIDAANCTAKTKSAAIHFGANGSATAITNVTISEVNAQLTTNHTTNLIAQAGDSTATIGKWAVIGNQNSTAAVSPGNTNIFDSNYSCTTATGGGTGQWSFCNQYGNMDMGPINACGSTGAGWAAGNVLAYCSSSTSGANIGSTAVITVPAASGNHTAIMITAQILVTTQATTSGTVPQVTIAYTDASSNVASTVIVTPVAASGATGCTSTPAFAANPAVGYFCSATIGPLFVKTGTTVNYATINYASVGGTAMVAQAFVTAYIN